MRSLSDARHYYENHKFFHHFMHEYALNEKEAEAFYVRIDPDDWYLKSRYFRKRIYDFINEVVTRFMY